MSRGLIHRYGLAAGLVVIALLLNLIAYAVVWAPSRAAQNEAESQWRTAREEIGRYKAYRQAYQEVGEITARALPKTKLPDMVTTLASLAKKRGLAIPGVTYQSERIESSDFQKVGLAFSISGPYADVRRFLNDLERSSVFVAIESLSLTRAAKESAHIEVQLRVAAYLRNVS
ncbi:MAG: type 4a pilus biogenesis protein PilO [Nitrospiria bacterium]